MFSYKNKSILYICQNDTSGYSNAAKGYIYDLIKKRIPVKSSYFDYGCNIHEEDEFDKYIRLNSSNDIEYNTIIIHSTPEAWIPVLNSTNNINLKNKTIIGRTVWEFEKLPISWVDNINNSKVTHVSVPTEWNKKCFKKSGVIKPIIVEPHIYVDYPYKSYKFEHLLNKSLLICKNEPSMLVTKMKTVDFYKFYCIGQLINRKGILDTVESFCKSFNANDKVVLMLKTFKANYSELEKVKCMTEIFNITNYYNHAPIIFIKESLNYDEIRSLHEIGNCYIQLTKTEGFGLGIFDAYNVKNDIIVTGYGAHTSYLGKKYKGFVDYTKTPLSNDENIFFNFKLDNTYKWAIPDKNHAVELIKSKLQVKKTKKRNLEFIGDYGEMTVKIKDNNSNGKINLGIQTSFYSHRSGWDYVIHNLSEFNNPNGVFFDGFVENAFCWNKRQYISKDIIPYTEPWVGFLHNPPNMPLWFSDNNSYPQSLLHDEYFVESLKYCKGLYVLSDYYKRFLKHYIPNIPVNVLYHPTEIPAVKFNFDEFVKNKNKKVISIGWWLRRLNSIFLLNNKNYNKVRLMPNNKCKDTIIRLTDVERSLFDIKLSKSQLNSVDVVDHLENNEYDDMLSKNIVFLDLYDTSANNAVIECIARGTPLLINKHPATIEYLGEDYPFYFDTLEDASEKLNNFDLIKHTNEYLMTFDKRKQITIEYFKKQFKKSDIYKSL